MDRSENIPVTKRKKYCKKKIMRGLGIAILVVNVAAMVISPFFSVATVAAATEDYTTEVGLLSVFHEVAYVDEEEMVTIETEEKDDAIALKGAAISLVGVLISAAAIIVTLKERKKD